MCMWLGDIMYLLLPSSGNSAHCICQNRLVKLFTRHLEKKISYLTLNKLQNWKIETISIN